VEYMARLEALRADIAAARSALAVNTAQLAAVSNEIDPLVPQAAAADDAARRGDLSLAAATTTRLALLDKQVVEAVLAQSVSELEIALEVTSGRRLRTLQ
jgi:hypothetical protein